MLLARYRKGVKKRVQKIKIFDKRNIVESVDKAREVITKNFGTSSITRCVSCGWELGRGLKSENVAEKW